MTNVLLIVGAVLGSLGGLAGGIAVLRKVGPEKTNITVGTADTVMVGQTRFIERLEASLQAVSARCDGLDDEVSQLRGELRKVTDERDALHRENGELKSRVDHLEQRVRDLSSRQGRDGERGPAGRAGSGATGATGATGAGGEGGEGGEGGAAGTWSAPGSPGKPGKRGQQGEVGGERETRLERESREGNP